MIFHSDGKEDGGKENGGKGKFADATKCPSREKARNPLACQRNLYTHGRVAVRLLALNSHLPRQPVFDCTGRSQYVGHFLNSVRA